MAKPYDDGLKQLVRANPRAFVLWLFPQAEYVREHPYELKEWKLEVDTLIEVLVNGLPMLQHIEFQTRHDPTIAERLQCYNILLWSEYNIPVLSWVISLLKDEHAPSSPLKRRIPTGKTVHEFHFESIDLAELLTEDLVRLKQLELLPLLTLTKDGARREVVKQMRENLLAAGRLELVQVGNTLASLAFRQQGHKADQDWLRRSVREMHDLLRETPVYQDILQEGREEGLEQGLKQGLDQGFSKGREEGRREGSLQALRHMLLSAVQARFPTPKLIRQAKGQAAIIEDPTVLENLILKVSLAQTAEEAENHLLNWPSNDDELN